VGYSVYGDMGSAVVWREERESELAPVVTEILLIN
jgi:hypothetical protein